MRLILGLVVGGVEVVHATLQTSLHDGEVLVRQGHVDHKLRTVTAEELAQFGHRVGIDTVGYDAGASGAGCDLLGDVVAFLLRARRENNLGEHFRMLGALVGDYCSHASGADNHDFSHYFFVFYL